MGVVAAIAEERLANGGLQVAYLVAF